MFIVLVILSVLYVTGNTYHCSTDELVETTSIEYDIDKKSGLSDYHYWISNMQFFVFGKITEPSNAIITAGFYTNTSRLVYSVTVDCRSGSWYTRYQDWNMTEPAQWKSGNLNKACVANEEFDITYELQQRRRGKFMFNSQPMEHTLVDKGDTGLFRIEKLPMDLTNGSRFIAVVTDGAGIFDRYANGKCFAFPHSLKRNCTKVKLWMAARSKLNGEYEMTIENVRYPTGVFGAGEFGAWTLGHSVECWSEAPQFFSVVQSSVHADENSKGYPYCCCSYMNGTLDAAGCKSNYELGGTCSYTCISYVDADIYNSIMSDSSRPKTQSGKNDTYSDVVG